MTSENQSSIGCIFIAGAETVMGAVAFSRLSSASLTQAGFAKHTSCLCIDDIEGGQPTDHISPSMSLAKNETITWGVKRLKVDRVERRDKPDT